MVDGVASVLDIDYLDRELIPGLTKEIAQHSIYQYIEEDLKLQIGYAKKEIWFHQSIIATKSYWILEKTNTW